MISAYTAYTAASKDPKAYRYTQAEQSVRVGVGDIAAYRYVVDKVPRLASACQSAARTAPSAACPLGLDTWALFSQRNPRDSGYGSGLVRVITERIRQSKDYGSVRALTIGDDWASACAAASVISTVMAEIPAKVVDAANRAEQAQREADDARAYAEIVSEDMQATLSQVASAKEDAEVKARAARAAKEALESVLSRSSRTIRGVVADAVRAAGEAAAGYSAACAAYGSGTTEATGGLTVEQKAAIASRLTKNSEFLRLAQLIGRMTATAMQKIASRTRHLAGAIVDITLGSDIGRLLDDELLDLVSARPAVRRLALTRLINDAAMEYDVEDREPQSRGPMVVLVDESGSMAGKNEAHARAMAVALARVAISQHRAWAAVCYQSTVTAEYRILPGAPAAETLLAFTARGTGGGTDFDPPLSRAVQLVSESVYADADIVFITDGYGPVSPRVVAEINAMRASRGLSVITVLIGSSARAMRDSVRSFSDRIFEAASLTHGVADQVFDGVA
jgi:uncharacterized protein with von Willebrand factor type A (vWA) domain